MRLRGVQLTLHVVPVLLVILVCVRVGAIHRAIESMRRLDLVWRQRRKLEDLDAVADEADVLHVPREVVRNGREARQDVAFGVGVEVGDVLGCFRLVFFSLAIEIGQ